ncbi:purine-binding chemotaxis protein CheW [Oceanisphaera litoralis]|uniref:chemotaxis protein CheW n=1 Tax=Oceanisphaera litoralis TaxID=225144 RepID=UPI00195635CA|nr:chemotaxis protein CheW [Oceanisphaera litoralis]MBM7456587.1 purine-binding chemotaxis protein CheW [Oceanisphaera litoralis]
MNQRQSDALDDYFGALLEESSPAPSPSPSPLPARPVPVAGSGPATLFADPAGEERRRGLEVLLARVAELTEEESLPPPVDVPAPEPEREQIPLFVPPLAPVSIDDPVVTEPVPLTPPMPITTETPVAAEVPVTADVPVVTEWHNMDTESSFQALFFEVAGMTFAVPLTRLGGIHQMARLTSLFGQPHWFAGVLSERERQFYVVDTARWAMPGHQDEEEYRYLVTLGDSNWGLGCHQLKGTALLTREQVKWRAVPGSRPWLAGMVKDKMCALLHVDALIGLLEQGKNIDGHQV